MLKNLKYDTMKISWKNSLKNSVLLCEKRCPDSWCALQILPKAEFRYAKVICGI